MTIFILLGLLSITATSIQTKITCSTKHARPGTMSDGTFLTSVSGQIEWLDVMAPAGSSYHCKYEYIAGPDWKIIGGLEAGLSQLTQAVNNCDKVVLNFPVEVQFKSTNPYGWPQMILSVYRETQLEGYGRVHLPLKPGQHGMKVPLFRPQSSSLLGYISSFFGYRPELVQPKVLANAAANVLLRMEHVGVAYVWLSVVYQGFQGLGYDLGKVS